MANKNSDFNELVNSDSSIFINGTIEKILNLNGMCAIYAKTHAGVFLPPIPFYKEIPEASTLVGWNFELIHKTKGIFTPKNFMKIKLYRYVVGRRGPKKEVKTYSFKKPIEETEKLTQKSEFRKLIEEF